MRRIVLVLIVVLGLAGAPARAAEITPQTLVEIPTTDITAIELHRLPCFGPCPMFTLRLTADGRARFIGNDQRGHQGVLHAQVDFRTLAAWIGSQHLETLARQYYCGCVDLPGIEVDIERPSENTRYRSNSAMEIPLRLEGVVLALEGEIERAKWRKEDALTPFFGDFTNGGRYLYVDESLPPARTTPEATGTAVRCGLAVLEQSRGTIRIRCDEKGTSILVATADGFVATGDAIAPGPYRRLQLPSQPRRSGEIPPR